MLSRGALFAIGLFALLGGLSLSYLWYNQAALAPAQPVVTQVVTRTVLVASHALPAGTLLRPGDMAWEERQAAAVMGADIVRGSASETDFVGAVTRRAFAARAPLAAGDMVKPGDRDFLVTALAPGYRAVSINVDAVQSTSGLALPGDRVDVILTQSFAPQSTDAGHRTVGETVLRNLRVIAVDQTLMPVTKPTDAQRDTLGQVHMPKTVQLEVRGRRRRCCGGRPAGKGPARAARTAGPGRAPAGAAVRVRPSVGHLGGRRLQGPGETPRGACNSACRDRCHARRQDRASV
jgi:pilus assembly protein CpaB